MEPILAKLSPEAQQFLQVLKTLDYLRPEIAEPLFQKLLHHNEENVFIELGVLKRYAAIVLFEQRSNLPKRNQSFLDKDWKHLFG